MFLTLFMIHIMFMYMYRFMGLPIVGRVLISQNLSVYLGGMVCNKVEGGYIVQ